MLFSSSDVCSSIVHWVRNSSWLSMIDYSSKLKHSWIVVSTNSLYYGSLLLSAIICLNFSNYAWLKLILLSAYTVTASFEGDSAISIRVSDNLSHTASFILSGNSIKSLKTMFFVYFYTSTNILIAADLISSLEWPTDGSTTCMI